MQTEQQDLVDGAAAASRQGLVEPIDAWFAEDLGDVERALAFAEHVLDVMEADDFADYELGSIYLDAFEEFFTACSTETVGQSRLTDYRGEV